MEFKPGSIALAVDTKDIRSAIALINDVRDHVSMVKLGLEFFIANGPQGVNLVYKETGMPIFLDLKLLDIPNTVRGAIESILAMGSVCITTIHLSGGSCMLGEAVDACCDHILLAGVTMLTSSDATQESVHGGIALADALDIPSVVCPGSLVPMVKSYSEKLITIVPGIRLPGSLKHDQLLTSSPSEAIKNGADILVVGRAITQSKNRCEAAKQIVDEVQQALAN